MTDAGTHHLAGSVIALYLPYLGGRHGERGAQGGGEMRTGRGREDQREGEGGAQGGGERSTPVKQ